jgi:hypothetical protein
LDTSNYISGVEDPGLEFDDHGYGFDCLQLVEDPGLEFGDGF